MRLLYLAPYYDAGLTGPEQLMERYGSSALWCRAVLGAGADAVTVLQRFTRDAETSDGGVRWLFMSDGLPPALPRLRPPAAFFRRAAAEPADVAHLNGGAWHARALRRTLPPATAIAWQHHGGPLPRVPFRPLLRHAFAHTDLLLFTAPEQADEWRAAGLIPAGVPAEAVIEASSAFLPVGREEARRSTGIAGDPAVLWVGRLEAVKDPLTVLRGFARTVAALPHAHLTMVYGGGSMLGDVRSAVDSLGLSGRVTLRGEVPHNELPAWYSAADLFVLGSHREGSGFALIESLACGCTPVVTAIPSFRAITAGIPAALLWPAGDADAFGAALRSAPRDAAARAAVVEGFRRHLSPASLGAAAVRAYRRAAAGRTGGRGG